jgi:hypothetical protein
VKTNVQNRACENVQQIIVGEENNSVGTRRSRLSIDVNKELPRGHVCQSVGAAKVRQPTDRNGHLDHLDRVFAEFLKRRLNQGLVEVPIPCSARVFLPSVVESPVDSEQRHGSMLTVKNDNLRALFVPRERAEPDLIHFGRTRREQASNPIRVAVERLLKRQVFDGPPSW